MRWVGSQPMFLALLCAPSVLVLWQWQTNKVVCRQAVCVRRGFCDCVILLILLYFLLFNSGYCNFCCYNLFSGHHGFRAVTVFHTLVSWFLFFILLIWSMQAPRHYYMYNTDCQRYLLLSCTSTMIAVAESKKNKK